MDVHANLIAYFNAKLSSQLLEEEEELIRNFFKYKRLRKHQYLLQEGDICKYAGFIVHGTMKQYTIDDLGKENILGLYLENWWIGDRESFFKASPSPYFIDACQEVDLLLMSKDDYDKHLIGQRFMTEIFHLLVEKQNLQLLKRVYSVKTLTAEQRLAELEKNYPEFIQRFPQHIIASYLGMTKETLSRIRAGFLKKK